MKGLILPFLEMQETKKENFMIYYKIIVSLPQQNPKEYGSQQKKRTMDEAIAQQLLLHTNEYHAKNPDRLIFPSSLSESKCYIGAFCRKRISKRHIVSYLQEIGQAYTDICFSETTFDTVFSMLRIASRNRFVEDEDEFLEKLELDQISRWHDKFDEFVLAGTKSKNALMKSPQKYLSSSLKEEIERVFACPTSSEFIGHPVHYLVETDSFENSKKLFEPLLYALYRTNRLQNRRYTLIDPLEQANRYRMIVYDQLGKSSKVMKMRNLRIKI